MGSGSSTSPPPAPSGKKNNPSGNNPSGNNSNAKANAAKANANAAKAVNKNPTSGGRKKNNKKTKK